MTTKTGCTNTDWPITDGIWPLKRE